MAKSAKTCLQKSSSTPNLSTIQRQSSFSTSQTTASARPNALPTQLTANSQRSNEAVISQTSPSLLNRRTLLTSVVGVTPSVLKKAANYSAQSTAIWWGSSGLVWPIDPKTLSEIAETCVKTRTAVGLARDPNMFFVHHMFQNVVDFYENLLNDKIDRDHIVLRLIYQHLVSVLEHLRTLDVCTEDALSNFEKMRKAMESELDGIQKELYENNKVT